MARDPATHVGAVVIIDGVEMPCDPDKVSPLSGLKVTWGRDNRLSTVPASTCDFELADPGEPGAGYDDYTNLVHLGSAVEVLAINPDDTRLRVFFGYVSDLAVTHDTDDALVKVTAADPTTILGGISLGDTPWVRESVDARSVNIRQAINAALAERPDPRVRGEEALPNLNIATSSVNAVIPMDVDNQTALDLITAFVWGMGQVPYPIAYEGAYPRPSWVYVAGQPYYNSVGGTDTRANDRIPYAEFLTNPNPGVPVPRRTVCLDACDIDLDGTEFTANLGDTSQAVRVTFGPTDAQRTYFRPIANQRVDQNRVFEVTSWADTRDETSPNSNAAYVLSQWVAQMTPWTQDFEAPWAMGAVVVDPDTVTGMDNFNVAMARLLQQTTRVHHCILVQHLPAWPPWRDVHTGAPVLNVLGHVLGGTYAFEDGRWLLEMTISVVRSLQSDLAPPATIVVRPGDVVPYPHDTTDAILVADPQASWPMGVTATFTDGLYGWNGTQWVQGGPRPIVVHPGDVVAVPHDDPRVVASPASAWGPTAYATFSDGQYTWTGSAWVVYVAPVYVRPGDVVDVPHDASNVHPVPTTPWDPDTYATFSDGTFRWDGAAWAPVTVVTPGATVDVAHDAPDVIPEPADAWDPDDYATFSDGTFRWDGDAWVVWVQPVQPWPGEIVAVAHTDPAVVLPGVPAARWPWDGQVNTTVAGFSDGAYAWRESAANPQGYWAQLSSFTATSSVKYAWLPLPHNHAAINPPRTDATTVVLFSDGPYEASGGAYVPTNRAGYDGATVPYAHTDARVVAIPGVPWPTTTEGARGRPIPYVVFTDGVYRWDGTAWVPSDVVPPSTAWADAPGTWNDVPAGTSWDEWTGDI